MVDPGTFILSLVVPTSSTKPKARDGIAGESKWMMQTAIPESWNRLQFSRASGDAFPSLSWNLSSQVVAASITPLSHMAEVPYWPIINAPIESTRVRMVPPYSCRQPFKLKVINGSRDFSSRSSVMVETVLVAFCSASSIEMTARPSRFVTWATGIVTREAEQKA